MKELTEPLDVKTGGREDGKLARTTGERTLGGSHGERTLGGNHGKHRSGTNWGDEVDLAPPKKLRIAGSWGQWREENVCRGEEL